MEDEPSYIVVIGASAGGMNTLIELVSKLEPEDDMAYFVVLHLSNQTIGSYLLKRLQKHTRLKCMMAEDDLTISKGTLYVAMPNKHLLLNKATMTLGVGARENRWRPSIDLMLRSAAASYTSRVIAIILTGLLNDGTSGMVAVKRCGGMCIVQDPEEAEFPDMPLSVLDAMEVDHCVPVGEMAGLLRQVSALKPKPETEAPADLVSESAIAKNMLTGIAILQPMAEPSPYSCPDCGGVLFHFNHDKVVKFKCHTGHAYTERDLVHQQAVQFEAALWSAIRSMEERKNLLSVMANKYSKNGTGFYIKDLNDRIKEMDGHITTLKKVVVGNENLPLD